MTSPHHQLVELWRRCPLNAPPHILPDDKIGLQKVALSVFRSFEEYAASNALGEKTDKSPHVGLLPIPYIGNLQQARVFILMLNPGLSHADYYAEYNVAAFREALIRNLRQEGFSSQSPSIFLDPQFAWHSGFGYWQRKLHGVAEELRERLRITYQQALNQLREKVACLELFPYHSKNFGVSALLDELPSVQAMITYVHEVIVPKARSGEATVIVTRGVKLWKLPDYKRENIILYEGSETRAAHLTLDSRKAITNQLGL